MLAGLHHHFILVQQVQAKGGLGAVGQCEVIGAGEGGGVFQFEDAHPHRGGLAVGAGVEPADRVKVQLDGSRIRFGLGGGFGFGGVFGTRRQQQQGGGCE